MASSRPHKADIPLADRFKSHITKKGPYPSKEAIAEWPEIEGTRCHIWIAYCDVNGYGKVTFDYLNYYVHRVAWELAYGKIPKAKKRKDQLCVLHKCDNPSCARLLHLYLDTKARNNTDRSLKGRTSKGKKHGILIKSGMINFKVTRDGKAHGKFILQGIDKENKANFTKKKIRKIKNLYKIGKYTREQLAAKYNVTYGTITRLLNNTLKRRK